ncbi:glycosyltransferase [Roseococcus sp. DSY-14]|uniref:glycosyltransferase n=1 Tax=Roseococcus sp. DSY-14 TaxID=3369650 RepID=UPI00387B9516
MDGARLFLDLSALLGFFGTHRAPMGMARVQMALLEAALAPPALLAPVAFPDAAPGLREVPAAPLRALLDAARAGGDAQAPDFLQARAALEAALLAAPAPRIGAGDRILHPAPQRPDDLLRLLPWQEAGALLCVLFHDAIPLSAPEHVPLPTLRDFGWLFGTLCLAADRVAAVSRHSAAEFTRWQRRFLPGLELPVAAMPMDAPFPAAPPGALPPPLADGRPFVLCVSTLESRKDHATLLRAWKALLRRHGEAAVPDLVLVGREGFGAEAALRLLRQVPELARKVHWRAGLGDGALAALYRACLFSVFNSFEEGWGLPVTEALAFGKLVLAPDHSSLREAGGEAALYFPPGEAEALAALAWTLVADPARRRALEAERLPRARLRPWRAVAEGLARDLLAGAPALPPPVARMPLPLDRHLMVSPAPDARGLPPPGSLLPLLLRAGDGWGGLEPGGCWLLRPPPGGHPARLRVPALPGGGTRRLFLEFESPPAAVTLHLRAGGRALAVPMGASEARLLVVDLPPGEDAVEFGADGAAAPIADDPRRLVARLRALRLCDARHAPHPHEIMEPERCHVLPAPPP